MFTLKLHFAKFPALSATLMMTSVGMGPAGKLYPDWWLESTRYIPELSVIFRDSHVTSKEFTVSPTNSVMSPGQFIMAGLSVSTIRCN